MSGQQVRAAWGKCAICDLEVLCDTVDDVARRLTEHRDQAHPDVQFTHQIDQARLDWQLTQNRMH